MIAQCLSCNRIVEVSTVYLWWKESYHDKVLCVCGNSSDTCCDMPIKFRILTEERVGVNYPRLQTGAC